MTAVANDVSKDDVREYHAAWVRAADAWSDAILKKFPTVKDPGAFKFEAAATSTRELQMLCEMQGRAHDRYLNSLHAYKTQRGLPTDDIPSS